MLHLISSHPAFGASSDLVLGIIIGACLLGALFLYLGSERQQHVHGRPPRGPNLYLYRCIRPTSSDVLRVQWVAVRIPDYDVNEIPGGCDFNKVTTNSGSLLPWGYYLEATDDGVPFMGPMSYPRPGYVNFEQGGPFVLSSRELTHGEIQKAVASLGGDASSSA